MRKNHVFCAVSLLVVSLAALWFYGRPAYRHYKETRALEQAKGFLAKQEYRQASVSARAALVANPANIEATRMLCELAEMARAPQALDWRRRIAELEPTSENKLRLAEAALRLQPTPFSLAAGTLSELSNSPPYTAQFHLVCAELCLKLKDLQGAERQYEAAIGLDPTNEVYQLNRSVLGLGSANPEEVRMARGELERLRNRETVGPVALRWLVAEAIKREEFGSAVAFGRELQRTSASTLEDRLQYLSALKGGKEESFQAELQAVEMASATNGAAIYLTTSWMLNHGMADEVWDWLQSCPGESRRQQPAPMAVVDCLMARKDWSGLEEYLAEENWGELDFLRHGFYSRALAEQRRGTLAEAMWRNAVSEADNRLGPLTALLEMARTAGRSRDVEDLLWQIAQRFPREKWVLKELDRIYLLSGNTRGLQKLYSARVRYEPDNYAVRNNLAATSLLLRLDLVNAHAMAKEVYEEHPEEASIAATYAYSLHIKGRTREGLEVLEKLGAKSLEDPSVALYYGVLLSATGDTARAMRCFEIAKGSPMLPEEKLLMGAGKGK